MNITTTGRIWLVSCLALPLLACGLRPGSPVAPTPTRSIVISSTPTPVAAPTEDPANGVGRTAPNPTDTATPSPVAISISDFSFSQTSVTVPKGTFVVWTNTGSSHHTVTEDKNVFESGTIQPGQIFSLTFAQTGTFTYHCGWHPTMQATIVVV